VFPVEDVGRWTLDVCLGWFQPYKHVRKQKTKQSTRKYF
jgi:hypothetical protein